MGVKFDDFLNDQLKNSEFRVEYEALQTEHAVIQAIIDARKDSDLAQEDLAKRTRRNDWITSGR